MSKDEVKTSKENNKKKTILIIVGVILLIVILFLLWFFNRKFDVTFDLNNNTKDIVVKVKYNKVIEKNDIKTSKDLGDSFINWYEVIEVKDNEDILGKEAFDFNTKIKKNTKLKAVYEGIPETITIEFDTRGGTSIEDIVINKNAELTLPSNPTYSGYKFVCFEDANGNEIINKTKFSEDTTLYARWEKIEEVKETPKKEEVKEEIKEEPKKEDKISLSYPKNLIHRNGITSVQANVNVENANTSDIVYSIVSGKCATVNSKTGVVTAVNFDSKNSNYRSCVENGETVEIAATLPSGKKATSTVYVEKDLTLTASSGNESKTISSNSWFSSPDVRFEIVPNMDVEWFGKCVNHSNCKYTGSTATLKRAFRGSFEQTLLDTGEVVKDTVLITAKTPAGQHIDYKISRVVN